MFDFEPSEEEKQRRHYLLLSSAIDSLSEFQSKLRSIAVVASEVGNIKACNEAFSAADVVEDVRSTFMLLQDKVIRNIRDGKNESP
jgi:hypothetical protein